MDQKRLLAAIALSVGILLIFDLWNRPAREAERLRQAEISAQQQAATPAAGTPGAAVPVPVPPTAVSNQAPGGATAAPAANRAPEQRVALENASLQGSIGLRGARLDDLVLRRYRETVRPDSPLVRLFAPRTEANPYFAQWGWTAADGRTVVPGK